MEKPILKITTKSASMKKALKKNNVVIHKTAPNKKKTEKYSKRKHLFAFYGFDLLENLISVRIFIQKKYEIQLTILEVLLFIAPKQFITMADYKVIAKDFSICRIKSLIDKGWLKPVTNGQYKYQEIYGLTIKCKNMIAEFYGMMSGEIKLVHVKKKETLVGPKSTLQDKKINEMIKKFNLLEIPESKRSLFE